MKLQALWIVISVLLVARVAGADAPVTPDLIKIPLPEVFNTGDATRDAIETAFDRNKGALYALYGRALRDNPGIEGEFRFEVVVQADGAFSGCRIIKSELNVPELETKLCSRINLIRMPPIEAPRTFVKSLQLFPAA